MAFKVPRNIPVVAYCRPCNDFQITLRAKGFDVRGEVTSRRGSAILDLVLFIDRQPVLIIEVKPPVPKRNWTKVKVLIPGHIQEQLDDYRRTFSVEVRLVWGMSHAEKFCESIENLLEELGVLKVPRGV
jgi:hypothetical protein